MARRSAHTGAKSGAERAPGLDTRPLQFLVTLGQVVHALRALVLHL